MLHRLMQYPRHIRSSSDSFAGDMIDVIRQYQAWNLVALCYYFYDYNYLLFLSLVLVLLHSPILTSKSEQRVVITTNRYNMN